MNQEKHNGVLYILRAFGWGIEEKKKSSKRVILIQGDCQESQSLLPP
jgi:hypothetical protein